MRPYDRKWQPGHQIDLLRRELHAVVHDRKRNWKSIIDTVSADLWETGLGSEIFVNDDFSLRVLREESQRQQRLMQNVGSVARTEFGNIKELTIAEAKKSARRSKKERNKIIQRFAAAMASQLDQHGDRRLKDSREIAENFTKRTFEEVDQMEAAGDDPIERILERCGELRGLITGDTTVEEFGELTVYIKHLKCLSEGLCPPAILTARDVPPNALPSYSLEQKIAKKQRRASRVSGSDFGDGYIASLLLYADGVEVDRRTHEYLTQIQRACPEIGSLMRHFFKSSDYAEIPERCLNDK